MTSRSHIEQSLRSLYAARVRGDLNETLKDIADDAVFSLNGRGTGHPAMSEASSGKAAIRSTIQQLINDWRFEDWKECSLLVDGDKAVLHWKARVTCIPTKKSDNFDVVDVITFRDGKIIEFRQTTDTALVMALASA